MHSLTNVDGKENKTEKGVNKHVAKNIRHKEFVIKNLLMFFLTEE